MFVKKGSIAKLPANNVKLSDKRSRHLLTYDCDAEVLLNKTKDLTGAIVDSPGRVLIIKLSPGFGLYGRGNSKPKGRKPPRKALDFYLQYITVDCAFDRNYGFNIRGNLL